MSKLAKSLLGDSAKKDQPTSKDQRALTKAVSKTSESSISSAANTTREDKKRERFWLRHLSQALRESGVLLEEDRGEENSEDSQQEPL